MADEAVLKQGADAWNAWRAAHAGTPADLANASLRGLDLARANLAGADCRKADLRGTILSGATLTDANLAGANFFKSVLDAADLACANLIGVQFLNCAQLKATRNWQLAFRDPGLACGAPVPMIADGIDTLTHRSGRDGTTLGNEDNLLRSPPLSTRCHPARSLALPSLHIELSRC